MPVCISWFVQMVSVTSGFDITKKIKENVYRHPYRYRRLIIDRFLMNVMGDRQQDLPYGIKCPNCRLTSGVPSL